MRHFRRLLNGSADRLATKLELGDEDDLSYAVLRSFRAASQLCPLTVDGRCRAHVRDFLIIVLRALCNTPYGQKLNYPSPITAFLSVGNFCSLGCSTCYSSSDAHQLRSSPNLIQTAEKIAASRVPFVMITGGEPSQAKNLDKAIELILHAGKYIYISTNAKADFLLDLAIRYPNQINVLLPLWGSPEKHDLVRGIGSFARLRHNLEILRDVSARPTLYIVDSGVDEIDAIVETALKLSTPSDRLDLRLSREIQVGRLDQSFRHSHRSSLLLRGKKLKSIIRKNKRSFRRIEFDSPEDGASKGTSVNILRFLFGVVLDDRCAAGSRTIHYDSFGRVHSCFASDGQDSGLESTDSVESDWAKLTLSNTARTLSRACAKETNQAPIEFLDRGTA